MERLLKGAAGATVRQRDFVMDLLAYRHGLRVSELVEARRADLSFEDGRVGVARKKNGLSTNCTNQPLAGDEIWALKAHIDDGLPWLFLSSQRSQMTRQSFNYLLARAGERADPGPVHPQHASPIGRET